MNIKPTPNSNCTAAMAWIYTGHHDGRMVGSLLITFRSGSIYRYDLVPVNIWAAICRSNSKGKAYNRLVKGRYASLCLTPSRPRRQPRPRYSAAERRARRNAEVLFSQYRQVAA